MPRSMGWRHYVSCIAVAFGFLASAEMPRAPASWYYRGLAELRQLTIESIQEALARSQSARRPPTGRRNTAGSFVVTLALLRRN